MGMSKLAIIGYRIVAMSLIIVIGLAIDHSSLIWAAIPLATFIFGHSMGPGAQGKTMAALSYPTELRGAIVPIIGLLSVIKWDPTEMDVEIEVIDKMIPFD